VAAGWLSEETIELRDLRFKQLTAKLLGAPPDRIPEEATKRLDMAVDSYAFKNFEWLGLFSDDRLTVKQGSPLDVLVARMSAKMQYSIGERDMLVMRHEFMAEYPDRRERITSTMIDYGIPHGDTSMSRTVGLPAAIAVRMILQEEVKLTGVHRPVIPELYNPVLEELEQLGIGFTENAESVAG
jgi:saccharopine dehydrogenase-like NADP-dependent oxidoreductase